MGLYLFLITCGAFNTGAYLMLMADAYETNHKFSKISLFLCIMGIVSVIFGIAGIIRIIHM